MYFSCSRFRTNFGGVWSFAFSARSFSSRSGFCSAPPSWWGYPRFFPGFLDDSGNSGRVGFNGPGSIGCLPCLLSFVSCLLQFSPFDRIRFPALITRKVIKHLSYACLDVRSIYRRPAHRGDE